MMSNFISQCKIIWKWDGLGNQIGWYVEARIPRTSNNRSKVLKKEQWQLGQPIFSVFESSEGHITVSIRRSRINSKFSSEISLYISAWLHFCIMVATIVMWSISYTCMSNKQQGRSNLTTYLDPFTIEVKPGDHDSFCKLMPLLSISETHARFVYRYLLFRHYKYRNDILVQSRPFKFMSYNWRSDEVITFPRMRMNRFPSLGLFDATKLSEERAINIYHTYL